MVTFVVVLLLLISVYWALKTIKKKHGCIGCANCSQTNCPAKTIQKLLDDSHR
ncbi:MAG: hypothetical protein ACI4U3_08985 [Traorella sp.]